MDVVKFSIRKSTFDKFIERIGLNREEVLNDLKAEAIKVGSGYRYVVDMESFFLFILTKLYGQSRVVQITETEFEAALDKWVDRLAGLSGYASLAEVRDAIMEELGISEVEFSEKLTALIQRRKGQYLLVEGGDRKVLVGSKKYGLIKRIQRRSEV